MSNELDEWEIVHTKASLLEESSSPDDSDISDAIDLENEHIANTILATPFNQYIIPKLAFTVFCKIPKPLILNLMYQVIKFRVTSDYRVSFIMSLISLYIFFRKYKYFLS